VRYKGDERILGDGEFVTALLSEAKEKFERSCYSQAIYLFMDVISPLRSSVAPISPRLQ
jgi:hypothetical protein